MNAVSINQMASRVKVQHSSVDALWQNEQTTWQQLGWSKAQVALWLASLPKRHHQAEPDAAYQVTPDLAQHLITLLTQAGKPLPIALLLKKLPAGVIATEQQLRKLARQNERLTLKGRLIILSD